MDVMVYIKVRDTYTHTHSDCNQQSPSEQKTRNMRHRKGREGFHAPYARTAQTIGTI